MKKLLSIMLMLSMALSMAACSSKKETPTEPTPEPPKVDKVAQYVDNYGTTLESSIEEGFKSTAGGLECICDITSKGSKLVIDISIKELNDVPEETKASLQETYESQEASLVAEFEPIKKELPELTGFEYNIREEDGDILATLDAEL